jgi:hypothetical protein
VNKVTVVVTEEGVVLSSDMLWDIALSTPYTNIDHVAVEGFISLYGLKKVISTLDILVAQYQANPEPVSNSTLALAKAFVKGVIPPENYVSYCERLGKIISAEIAVREEAEKKAISAKIMEDDFMSKMWT